jgi:rubrerythrin
MGDDDVKVLGAAAIAIGAGVLAGLLLKALFNPDVEIYQCPECNLVIRKYTNTCPRCGTELDWRGA